MCVWGGRGEREVDIDPWVFSREGGICRTRELNCFFREKYFYSFKCLQCGGFGVDTVVGWGGGVEDGDSIYSFYTCVLNL